VNKEELIKELNVMAENASENGYPIESEAIDAVADRIEQSLSGHVIVPNEPKMYQVFAGEAQFKQNRYSRDQLVNAYKAMLSAAKGE